MRAAILATCAAALAIGGAAAFHPARAAPAQPDYHPSMGDLMTMAVQPRHTKLWYGGQARNWPYAAYEASELRHAFERIARTIPSYRDTDVASAAQNNMKAPLDALDAAVKARDAAGFARAYARVTKGCNTCHESLEHKEVVIRTPVGPLFPDQDFRPRPGK
jgi:hypothetical protein